MRQHEVRCEFSYTPLPLGDFHPSVRQKTVIYKCPVCGAIRRCVPYWIDTATGYALRAKFPFHYPLHSKARHESHLYRLIQHMAPGFLSAIRKASP